MRHTHTTTDEDGQITHTFTIMPRHIREAWAALMEGAAPEAAELGHVQKYGRTPEQVISFAGMSGNQVADALAHGYYPEADGDVIRASAYGTEEILVPMTEVNEEDGELLIDQVLGGEDEYYALLTEVPQAQGARLRIEYGTCGGSSQTVMADYFEWCLHVIEELQNKGNAPSVDLVISLSRTFKGLPARDQLKILIPLVEEGEHVDPITWRAFLTPGGFRTLGFIALGIIAEDHGWQTGSGLGHCENPASFGVVYDHEDGIMHIHAPTFMPGEFPREKMSASLDKILERF